MIQRYAQFLIHLEKSLEIVSPSQFVYDFSRKIFLALNSINSPNFIFWLPLLNEILINICIAIVCELDRDVTKFEVNLIFLIKLFFCMTKKSRQKLKYLENEKSFQSVIKSIFYHFLICQKLSQTWECAFNNRVIYRLLLFPLTAVLLQVVTCVCI